MATLILTSCGKQDDFYSVTKIIYIQDTIFVNEPFDFRLVLRNDSLNKMKFTIDDTVQKSVFFNLFFRCNDQLLRSDVENPNNLKHNYQEYHLKNGDSLSYRLTGILRQVNNSLQMQIGGYQRIYKIENTPCDRLTIDFGGMWIPGDFNPLDAMQGYNFRKNIFVSLDTTKAAFSKK
ncbi:hypothetical protein [Pontibacter sp. BT731]|uniref:hypothetical protein n=1 Tax=Pontibacter coccineus TaxID=3063328 RepID=UPI0026E38914|nr:hypothetical protein [Pontibacter sp. BT731]